MTKRTALAASVLAMTALAGVVTPAPASALPFCCGVIKNTSSRATVTAMHHWCTDGEYLVGPKPCNSDYRTLAPGRQTSLIEDWDGVAIAGNCYGRVIRKKQATGKIVYNVPIDRRGRPAMWVRVHDDEVGEASQTC
ncbi:hypothetical protein SAMN05421504_113173 [Amycolatopsis xylanica]|uniref:Peptidase inhibitor family I36 n=1 Tax=Amycolatopsis xylanica TaxID=589385 RepID=A0A1H3SFU2_9PSEU|nr:hypothetical protein [Amycolatopsis xylanica]SDZ36455.1 hypothetical protein SAMN05421504_113173 [Amycolatopsis xylanica]